MSLYSPGLYRYQTMEWITIKKDNQLTTRLFLAYFHHEWKKKLFKQKLWLVTLPLAIILLINHLTTLHEETDYTYHFITVLLIFVLIYLPLIYVYQRIKFNKFIKVVSDESPDEFQFRFDEEGTFYQAKDLYLHQKWSSFKYYSLNGDAVYLYNDKKRIKEILSAEIIGFIDFNRAMDIIQRKLEPKYAA